MNITPEKACVLIATDSAIHGEDLLRMLGEHFESVALSSNMDRAVEDFEAHRPDVLVLAFQAIALAQRYYLGLNPLASTLQLHPHRTVLLCSKDEIVTAFDLCKKQYFDDYVLYWPFAYDGLRLPMSIWTACREMMALHAGAPQRSDLLAHARHMSMLEEALHQELSSGDVRLAVARDSLVQLEQEIASTHQKLSSCLSRPGAIASSSAEDTDTLSQELERVKSQQLAHARRARERALEPLSAWATGFRDRLEPALGGARALADQVREIRLKLMVIDDDEMTRNLIAHALHDGPYEILFAADGGEALRQLRRLQPDVILMDICMPGLDGISLTRRLKATPQLAAIPVIIMTGDSRLEMVTNSIDAGAVAFLVKPFTRQSVEKKLEEALAR